MNLQPTIHIHLSRDGSIFLLGEDQSGQQWFSVTTTRLESILTEAKAQGAIIEYSRDDPESDFSKAVELIFKIITEFKMPTKLLKEPSVHLP
jgi:hypothetical protein